MKIEYEVTVEDLVNYSKYHVKTSGQLEKIVRRTQITTIVAVLVIMTILSHSTGRWMFFMPFGLILGPLLGAYGFEAWFAKQEQKPAMISGVGSAVGTLAGIAVKSAVGAVMVIWFFVDVFLIG